MKTCKVIRLTTTKVWPPLEASMHYSPPKEKSLDTVNARLSAEYRLYTVAGRIRSSNIRVMPWVAPPTPAALCAEVHIT